MIKFSKRKYKTMRAGSMCSNIGKYKSMQAGSICNNIRSTKYSVLEVHLSHEILENDKSCRGKYKYLVLKVHIPRKVLENIIKLSKR
jgi:recombinational DNA repair protein RecR